MVGIKGKDSNSNQLDDQKNMMTIHNVELQQNRKEDGGEKG